MAQRELSARRVVGFACNQAFAFFLFYMGLNGALDMGGGTFERADLLIALTFMVVGFAILRFLPTSARNAMFTRPLLYVYAVVMAAGALTSFIAIPDLSSSATMVLRGALSGFPCALLLTAWGRTFGRTPTETSVPEVFVGSLVAALFCLAFSFVNGESPALLVMCLLPLGSVVNIEVPEPGEAKPQRASADDETGDEQRLSSKVLFGTLFFGISAGIALTLATEPGGLAVPYYPVSMILFGAFTIGALSLLLSDGFGRGAALNKSYRLAVYIMMVGVLVAPWPALKNSLLPGEAIVLAGYLGLEAVLVSLFLVLAEIEGEDTALSFSAGFLSLFAGQALGIIASNAIASSAPYAVAGVAGAIALASYVFLFTERDFDELSEIVAETDDFEATCARIVEQYGLSNRESEILAYALRGRTAERIAGELVISKSTVDTHLRRIYAKCGVHSRQELLDLAEQ